MANYRVNTRNDLPRVGEMLGLSREQVFDMFHTFSHGDQYAAGTGLGLAICRSIVAAHGGRTSVEDSPPGQGARVRMTLPLAAPAATQEEDL